jgi:hypothetical protein
MPDRTRANPEAPGGPEFSDEIPLARDLTECVLAFVRDRVSPVVDWVAWTGGDPHVVTLVLGETLRSIADGLDADTPDE